jgi:hypothetical protein
MRRAEVEKQVSRLMTSPVQRKQSDSAVGPLHLESLNVLSKDSAWRSPRSASSGYNFLSRPSSADVATHSVLELPARLRVELAGPTARPHSVSSSARRGVTFTEPKQTMMDNAAKTFVNRVRTIQQQLHETRQQTHDTEQAVEILAAAARPGHRATGNAEAVELLRERASRLRQEAGVLHEQLEREHRAFELERGNLELQANAEQVRLAQREAVDEMKTLIQATRSWREERFSHRSASAGRAGNQEGLTTPRSASAGRAGNQEGLTTPRSASAGRAGNQEGLTTPRVRIVMASGAAVAPGDDDDSVGGESVGAWSPTNAPLRSESARPKAIHESQRGSESARPKAIHESQRGSESARPKAIHESQRGSESARPKAPTTVAQGPELSTDRGIHSTDFAWKHFLKDSSKGGQPSVSMAAEGSSRSLWNRSDPDIEAEAPTLPDAGDVSRALIKHSRASSRTRSPTPGRSSRGLDPDRLVSTLTPHPPSPSPRDDEDTVVVQWLSSGVVGHVPAAVAAVLLQNGIVRPCSAVTPRRHSPLPSRQHSAPSKQFSFEEEWPGSTRDTIPIDTLNHAMISELWPLQPPAVVNVAMSVVEHAFLGDEAHDIPDIPSPSPIRTAHRRKSMPTQRQPELSLVGMSSQRNEEGDPTKPSEAETVRVQEAAALAKLTEWARLMHVSLPEQTVELATAAGVGHTLDPSPTRTRSVSSPPRPPSHRIKAVALAAHPPASRLPSPQERQLLHEALQVDPPEPPQLDPVPLDDAPLGASVESMEDVTRYLPPSPPFVASPRERSRTPGQLTVPTVSLTLQMEPELVQQPPRRPTRPKESEPTAPSRWSSARSSVSRRPSQPLSRPLEPSAPVETPAKPVQRQSPRKPGSGGLTLSAKGYAPTDQPAGVSREMGAKLDVDASQDDSRRRRRHSVPRASGHVATVGPPDHSALREAIASKEHELVQQHRPPVVIKAARNDLAVARAMRALEAIHATPPSPTPPPQPQPGISHPAPMSRTERVRYADALNVANVVGRARSKAKSLLAKEAGASIVAKDKPAKSLAEAGLLGAPGQPAVEKGRRARRKKKKMRKKQRAAQSQAIAFARLLAAPQSQAIAFARLLAAPQSVVQG